MEGALAPLPIVPLISTFQKASLVRIFIVSTCNIICFQIIVLDSSPFHCVLYPRFAVWGDGAFIPFPDLPQAAASLRQQRPATITFPAPPAGHLGSCFIVGQIGNTGEPYGKSEPL